MNINNYLVEKTLQLTIKQIKSERISLNLTQKEFADFVGVKYTAYRSFEQTGKIALENFIAILLKLNKGDALNDFLSSFEVIESKDRVRKENKETVTLLSPIISINQKQIILDKSVFGAELFYSVEDGYKYEVSNFIPIVLNKWNDKNLMLLIKYFGEARLKPYVLKQKDISLLKAFNKHIKYLKKSLNA